MPWEVQALLSLQRQTLNLENPASTGGMDSLFTIFEIGFEGKYTSYSTAKNSQSLFDANFRYISMGIRLMPKWAISMGLKPYSTIGYNINAMSELEGTTLLV